MTENNTTTGNPTAPTFDQECSSTRNALRIIGKNILDLKASIAHRPVINTQDTGEMIANVTLAYRHLEDAAMRLGKAIQAYDGGTSIYQPNDDAREKGEPVPGVSTKVV